VINDVKDNKIKKFVVVEGKEALDVWRDAWKSLGEENLECEKFDKKFVEEVRDEVNRLVRSNRDSDRRCLESDKLNRKIRAIEVDRAVKKLKKGKACGEDEVVNELFMYGGDVALYALWKMVNVMWRNEFIPDDWGRAVVTPLFKEGDDRDPFNYRGISLMSIIGKIYESILSMRMMEWCEWEGAIVEEQGGFRDGRGCVDQLFTFSEIIRGRGGKKLYCCFIDVRKAYDRVFRDGLWKRLWDVGVRGKMWRVIRGLYRKVKSSIKVNDECTEWFDIDVGVRQGSVLSPVLFSLFINGMAEEVKKLGLGVSYGDEVVSLLLYADDIVLCAESKDDLQRMMNVVNEYSVKWRLK